MKDGDEGPHIHDIVVFPDKSDDVIDHWAALLEAGVELYWEDIRHEDIAGRRTFLQTESNERDGTNEQEEQVGVGVESSTQATRQLELHVTSQVDQLKVALEAKVDQAIEVLRLEVISRFEQLEGRMEAKMNEVLGACRSSISSNVAVDIQDEHEGNSLNHYSDKENDGFYITPTCSMDNANNGNESDGDGVDKRLHVDGNERPQRQSKRSRYMEDPYTDPCKKKRFAKGAIKVYDPMRLPDDMRSSFKEYYDSPSKLPRSCGLESRPWIFFDKILTRDWLQSEVCVYVKFIWKFFVIIQYNLT